MTAQVFISHSSKDQDAARAIWTALENRGVQCWAACRDIGPGENFQASIVKAIRSAKVLVLVFTDNANNSDEIKKELALASQYKVTVIPVRIEDVLPSEALHYELITRQWINLFQDWENEIERLIAWISRLVSSEAKSTEPRPITRARDAGFTLPIGGLKSAVRVSLVASDSFELGAYRADPNGPAKGGIAVIQEIFGVNHHIRAICDRLADEGYAALAPAIFDRQQPNFESGYTPDEIANARKFVANPDWGAMLRDVQAGIDELKKSGPVAILGFCMGGTISFLAACKLRGLSAAVCYYGGQIAKNANEKPKVPTQMHFGEKDASIPISDVETIKQKRGGDCEMYVYPDAQHGFHCDERGSYQEAAAKLAWKRSMAFLAKNVK